MQRGDVWLVSLPSSMGREKAGSRPAIVLHDAVFGQGSPLVIVVPLTSQDAAARFPGIVTMDPDGRNGLTTRSIALVFQIRALDRARFAKQLGTVSNDQVKQVFEQLDTLLGR